MAEDLAKYGLYFDYLYNLRVLDPEVSNDTNDLKEKTGEYADSKCFWIVKSSSVHSFIKISCRTTGISENYR